MDLDVNSPPLAIGYQTPPSQEPKGASSEFDALLKRGLNFWPLLRTIKRKALLITGVTVLLTGFSAFRSSQAPLLYQGNFELLVEPITTQGQLADPTALARGVKNVQKTDYATQLRILTSTRLLREIVEAVRNQSPTYAEFSMENLERSLRVGRLGETTLSQTKIILVSYENDDPELVDRVLKATADRYLQYSLEDRKTQFGEGIKFIEDQLPEVQQRVSSLQDQLQRLQQQFNIINPGEQGERLAARVSLIEDLQNTTQRELRERLALQTQIQQQIDATPSEALLASTLSQNPRYQALLAELQTVEEQIRTESVRFSAASPVIQNLEEKRSGLVNLLRAEAETIVGYPIEPQAFVFQDTIRLDLTRQLLETANQIEVLEARSQEIAQSKGAVTQQLSQFPEISRRYSQIERELEIAQRTLEQLLTQRELLQIESAQTEVPWELVSDPVIDRDELGNPIPYPQSSKVILLALMGGVIFGTGLSVALEKMRNVFYTTEDVQDNLDLPLLGVIPYCQMEEQFAVSMLGTSASFSVDDHQKGRQAALSSRGISFIEAFSSLYASMRTPMSNDLAIRSLVVSSAEPGDGKTTVVHHLAQTIAAIGKKVLVVDANLYRPGIHQQMGLSNERGLGDVLAGAVSLDEAIERHSSNVFVLCAGQTSMGNSRLLASETMQSLMKVLHTQFDVVLYDAPHLMGLTDASFLASQTNGMFLVVGIEKTKHSVIMQVLSQLSTYKTPVLGMIANHIEAGTKNSYGYRTRYLQPPVVRNLST